MRGTPAWLLTLIIALMLVGLVSHTPVRHLIQISPCILSLVLFHRGTRWATRWAPISAMPLFALWFVLMALIWLFLLGVAKVITGHFTPVEIALTLVIGVCCLGGFSSSLREYKGRSILMPLVTFIAFLALQVGAVSLSMTSHFSRM